MLNRAPKHISRLPLRLVRVGTRMNSSSTRRKTVQSERCSRSSPLKTSPCKRVARGEEGVSGEDARWKGATKRPTINVKRSVGAV